MSIVLLFILVLVISFAVLLHFLKPTAMEKAVAAQLADIEKNPKASEDRGTILKEEVRPTTFMDELAGQLPFMPAIAKLIHQAGTGWRASWVVFLSVAAAAVGGWLAGVVTNNTGVGVLVGIALGSSPYAVLYFLRDKRRRNFDALLPEAVDLMSRGLRAGHSIAAVLEMVGREIADPVGTEFRDLHKEQTLGLPLRDAMIELVDRMPLDDLRFLATAILLQKESGGNLAQILDKTASVMRERARLKGQLRIYTAQGRITGWILCAAPFLMFGLISVVNHDYEKTLLTNPFGLKMVYGGLVMMVLGILAIRKIIDVKV